MPSLSQKYRPKTFGEITGQKHITETLRQEVATGILGHAFLFSGPRGVGKTTTARVFAKALNCEKPVDGEPCLACEACLAAARGGQLDLIELDAATHTQVEKIRENVIEHVRFAPMNGRRKIYVIDEAHMLSASSWNALLKTLEEPPDYAFFILATTELHKVPATVVSRCQRFEFQCLSDEELALRVAELARLEGLTLDDAAARVIVSKSEGCVRDAETLLGQLGSLGDAHITTDLVSLVIPESHLPAAANLMSLWADRNHAASLAEAQRLFEQGLPLGPLFDDLVTITRWLLEASGEPSKAQAWSRGAEDERATAPLVGRFSPGELNDIALLLFERRHDVKRGVDPLFALELAGTLVANGLLPHSPSVSPPSRNPTELRSTPPPLMTKESAMREEGRDADEPVVNLDLVRLKWQSVVNAVGEINHSLPFILKISQPHSVEGSRIIIRFQYPFHYEKIISEMKHRRVVEESLNKILDTQGITIDGVVGDTLESAESRKQDTVSNILKAFGGNVIEPRI